MKEIFSKIGKAVAEATNKYHNNNITEAGTAEITLCNLKSFLEDYQFVNVSASDLIKAEKIKGNDNITSALAFFLDSKDQRETIYVIIDVITDVLAEYRRQCPADALTE